MKIKRKKTVIFILVVVVVLLVLSLFFVIGVYYFYRFKNTIVPEGIEFGNKHTVKECMAESFRRDALCGSFLCSNDSRVFLKWCLKQHEKNSLDCQSIPNPSVGIIASVKWGLLTCEKNYSNHPSMENCSKLLRELQKYCFPESEKQ